MESTFVEKGWCRFPFDPELAHWVERTLDAARAAVEAPENAQWIRYGGTWFVGVHALPNDELGAVAGGPPLAGRAVEFVQEFVAPTPFDWDRAQISVCRPGYPQPMAPETEAAHLYRVKRDAAHVDGLLAEGPERRRHLREYHGFVLGIPMVKTERRASPFVVWERSHEIMRRTFHALFDGLAPDEWGGVDISDAYQAARREAFEACERIEITAAPGEAYLAHRFMLHGMAAWDEDAEAGPDGRMIAYFRPQTSDRKVWLNGP